MGKVVDITEKLGLEGRPELVIGKARVKVDNTAKTMMRVLAAIGDDAGDISPSKFLEVYELLFDEKARAQIDKLELSFDDFAAVVEAAMGLVTGSEEGNVPTPATTS